MSQSLRRKYVVFDFETDSTDPSSCQPVQLAAVVINPIKLELIEGAEFYADMKPVGIDNEDYFTSSVMSTIDWHANNQGVTYDEIVERWKNASDQRTVWQDFHSFVNKFNAKGVGDYWGPVPCGINIRGFDLPIYKRLNTLYGLKNCFFKRDQIDILDMCFYWFEGANFGPENYRMDTLRKYFGLSSEHAHDALIDVKQEAELIIRFLALHRRCALKCSGLRGVAKEKGK